MVDLSACEVGAEALMRRYKRKPFKPIDREQFREIRLMHRFSIEETAKLLQVTARTVAHWESGVTRIPYAAYKMLKVLMTYELPGETWQGWRVVGDTLYSPVNRAFREHELTYLSHYLAMARRWQEDYAKRLKHRQPVAKDAPLLRLIINRGES